MNEITNAQGVSLSGGKDSMTLLLTNKYDFAVFYDTGEEFRAIYNVIKKASDKIQVFRIHGKNSFEHNMFDKPVRKRGTKEIHKHGYGWCGGTCRWGTTEKLKELDKFALRTGSTMAIGIAADETNRIEKERKPFKTMPLVDAGLTEADCLAICREHGIQWLEETDSKFIVPAEIDLYDILQRVSCWCCRNKNLKELKNMFLYFTNSYWARLKAIEQRIGEKMKPSGWLHELEVKWEKELLAEGWKLKEVV